MFFLLNDSEVVSCIQSANRNKDGFLMLHIPENKLQGNPHYDKIVLTFDDCAKTVSRGKKSARLSDIQFALLKYVYENGISSYEELSDAIWGGKMSDGALRMQVSRINTRLFDKGFACEIVTRKSSISIERSA